MQRLTLLDRLISAAAGAFFGGLVGCALAWILGVYSNTFMGFHELPLSFKHLIGFCAIGFGAVGLFFGPFVGTLLGFVISGIFWFEHIGISQKTGIPTWLAIIILACAIAGVWWVVA